SPTSSRSRTRPPTRTSPRPTCRSMTTTTTRRSRRAEPRRGLQARTRWSNRSPHGDSSFDAMPFQARPWVPPAHDQLAGRPYDARTGPGLGRFDERPTVPDRDRRVGKLAVLPPHQHRARVRVVGGAPHWSRLLLQPVGELVGLHPAFVDDIAPGGGEDGGEAVRPGSVGGEGPCERASAGQGAGAAQPDLVRHVAMQAGPTSGLHPSDQRTVTARDELREPSRRRLGERRPTACAEEAPSEFRRQCPALVLLPPCPLAMVTEEGRAHFVARLHDAVRELCAFHSNDIVDGERLEGGRVPAAPLLEQALGYGDAEHACTDLDRTHSLILSALRGV